MKSRNLVIFLSVVLSILCTGCFENDQGKPITENSRFKLIQLNPDRLLIDKETRVEYYYTGYSISPLLDANGAPLIYKGEL